MDRRNFIKGSIGTLYMLANPSMAFPDTKITDKRLLIVLLRGGMDGLASIPPVGDRNLSKIRKDILVNGVEDLDGFFGINPALRFLGSEYHQGRAAFVHATSFPYTGRSHFDGQNIMETGNEQPYATNTGWIGRAMNAGGYSSLAVSLPIPIILRGNEINSNYFPSNFGELPSHDYDDISKLWNDDHQLSGLLDPIMGRNIPPGRGDTRELVTFAASEMHKPNGPRVGLLEFEGFDTHALQGNEDGHHADNLAELDGVLQNFKNSMGALYDNTVVVTVTEFGRTAAENGTSGTDHGYASAIFLAGGLVNGKQVISDWPGLSESNLHEGRDLLMTIDARDVYAEVVKTVFDLTDEDITRSVFPGYQPNEPLGIIRGPSEQKRVVGQTNSKIETIRLQWSIALSGDNYVVNREAADVIYFNKNLDITEIESTNISSEGISGRDKLQYSINNGTLKITGIIEVLGGERLLVNFSEPLTSRRAVNTFGASDELILTWQF